MGWAQDIPDWLKEEVKNERITNGLIDAMGKGKEEVGDAEACLYLFTAALARSLPHDTGQIYIYLSSKICKARGIILTEFMEERIKNGLNPDEERELGELKRELWTKRGGKIKSPLFEVLASLKKKKSDFDGPRI